MNAPPPSTRDRTALTFLGCALLACVALILLVAGALVTVLRTRRTAPPPPSAAPLPSSVAPPLPPSAAPSLPRLLWSHVGGLPLLLDVNGDGVEDLVGRVIDLQPSDRRVAVRIAAFDGKTHALLWVAGSFGEERLAAREVALVAGHGAVAAMDGKAQYALFDGRTGEEILRGEAEESGLQGCVGERGARVLWLGTKRGDGILFELAEKRSSAAKRPAACAAAKEPQKVSTAESTTLPWDAGRMIKMTTLREGPIRFAVGIDNWTKKRVTVAGFPATGVEPRWKRPIREGEGEAPPVDLPAMPVDLQGGRAIVVYPTRGLVDPWVTWRMQAIEAASGAEIWDVGLEGSGSSRFFGTPVLGVTEGRLFLAYESWLEIYERESGKRVARIGP